MHTALRSLTIITAVGSGLIGGVFYAFSTFAMKGIRALPPRDGIAAMQSINVAAPQRPLVIPMVGTTMLSIVVIVWSLFRLDEASAWYQLAGGLAYLVVVVTTRSFHVPRNDVLASLDASTADAARYWKTYVTEWTMGNHVRTAAGLAGAALLTIAVAFG